MNLSASFHKMETCILKDKSRKVSQLQTSLFTHYSKGKGHPQTDYQTFNGHQRLRLKRIGEIYRKKGDEPAPSPLSTERKEGFPQCSLCPLGQTLFCSGCEGRAPIRCRFCPARAHGRAATPRSYPPPGSGPSFLPGARGLRRAGRVLPGR